ncbi:MAG: hypothetical protein AB1325_14055, partial [Nitrospirota bacterium]
MEHLAHRNIKALNDCIRKMYSDMEMQSLPNTIISAASEIIPSNTAGIHALTFYNKKIIMALRVIEWVILYLLEHTCKYFQAQILLVSETVSPSLYNTNFV